MEKIYALENRLLSQELVNFEEDFVINEGYAEISKDYIVGESPVAYSSDNQRADTGSSPSPLHSPSMSGLQKLGPGKEPQQEFDNPTTVKPQAQGRRGSLFK